MTGAEITCRAGGRQVELFAPLLGTTCTRCASHLDDVCFLIRVQGETIGSGGLCAECLASLLEPHLHKEATS